MKLEILERASAEAVRAVRGRALQAVVRKDPFRFDNLVSTGVRNVVAADREATLRQVVPTRCETGLTALGAANKALSPNRIDTTKEAQCLRFAARFMSFMQTVSLRDLGGMHPSEGGPGHVFFGERGENSR